MELSNQDLELVRDALYARDMKYVGCFAFNKSSERVQEVGLPILPALEHVIRDEAMPSCPLDPTAQHEAFPGLSNLMVTYFQIAKDGQMDRAARFLSSIRGAVLIDAMRAIGIVWDNTIPDLFMPTIETLARTGSPEEREVALWSLDWHHNKPQIEEELAASRKEMGL
jgi:hypothetical protein